MKAVVVRLAFEDDAKILDVMGSALEHLDGLRGVAVLGGDGTTILVSAAKDDPKNGRSIAEFLAAGEDGSLDEAGPL